MPASVIINADDFGLSIHVNRAIAESFELGLLSSASLMVHTPGYPEARDMVLKNEFAVGLHLTLTDGCLLTPAAQSLQLQWKRFFRKRFFAFSPIANTHLAAIQDEFSAQIERALGDAVPLAFLDSHHHVHTNWWIGAVVLRLAKRFHIPAVRIHANLRRPKYNMLRAVYCQYYNKRLLRCGLARSTFFGSIDELPSPRLRHGDKVEIMVHPTYDANGVVVDVAGPRTAPLVDRLRMLQRLLPAGRLR